MYTLQDTEAFIYNVTLKIKEFKFGTKFPWKSQIYQKFYLIENYNNTTCNFTNLNRFF